MSHRVRPLHPVVQLVYGNARMNFELAMDFSGIQAKMHLRAASLEYLYEIVDGKIFN